MIAGVGVGTIRALETGGHRQLCLGRRGWRVRSLSLRSPYLHGVIVKSRIPRGSAGVTLIELIIVLVIIGILIGLAAPAMGAMVNRNRLDGAIGHFTADVAYARMVAVRANRQVEIVMQYTSYTVQRVELNGQKTQIKRLNLATEYPGMSISTNLALPATLTFNSRGLLQNAAVNTVTVQQNSKSASVEVLASGRVYRVY